MSNLVRMAIVCGACGASVTVYDSQCSFCNSKLESAMEIKYRLPACQSHPNSVADANQLSIHIQRLLNNQNFKPVVVDELIKCLTSIISHDYIFIEFLFDTLSLSNKLRSICSQRQSEEVRQTELELLKRINAIYFSFVGKNYLP